MKMAVIGGGGVRAPLFVGSALKRADTSGLTEICLHDVDARKLELFGGLSQQLALRQNSNVKVSTTTRLEKALDGASHVVTTVRPGAEEGRIRDEKIALKLGVIGQETTGPGGFAMAMRSIPVILDCAEKLHDINPDAWLFNFTNPAGLVTQALSDAGFDRAVGICDSANAAQDAVAEWLGVHYNDVRHEVFGLNHLSFVKHAYVNNAERLQELLANDGFLSESMMRLFDKGLVKRHRLWMNEYLYYYYYAEQALASIQADKRTRGEEVRDLNQALMDQLDAIGVDAHPQTALDAYFAYEERRSSTYMHYADETAPSMEDADGSDVSGKVIQNEEQHDLAGGGYAGVALNIINALESDDVCYTGLNVRNGTAMPLLGESDVIEVSCRIDKNGVTPQPVGDVPDAQAHLIQSVKRYERLTVAAIREKSRDMAIEAMAAHPLVVSYSLAEQLVDSYIEAHSQFIGDWA